MRGEVKHYWPEEIVGTGELVVYLQDYAALEAECERLRQQVATLQSDANSWQSGYDKGREDGAKAAEGWKAQHARDSAELDDCRRAWGLQRAELAALKAPAPAQDEQPAVFWVLFDATGPERFIKKDVRAGTLAFFDSEDEAQRAKRRHPGTDYKRVEYYRAPIAQPPADGLVEALETAQMAIMGYTHQNSVTLAALFKIKAALAAELVESRQDYLDLHAMHTELRAELAATKSETEK